MLLHLEQIFQRTVERMGHTSQELRCKVLVRFSKELFVVIVMHTKVRNLNWFNLQNAGNTRPIAIAVRTLLPGLWK